MSKERRAGAWVKHPNPAPSEDVRSSSYAGRRPPMGSSDPHPSENRLWSLKSVFCSALVVVLGFVGSGGRPPCCLAAGMAVATGEP